MKKNIPVIATAVVAVCIIAIVAVLGIKATNSGPDIQAGEPTATTTEQNSTYFYEESTTNPFWNVIESTTALIEQVTSTTAADITTTTKKETTTQKETTTKEPETEQVTVPSLDPDEMESGHATAPVSPGASLPKDMSLYGLRVQGYDVIGLKEYIYNNDTKEGNMQHNFGYNPLYDLGANLIDFSIDTCRLKFTYGDKDYMIQIWKGQYISGSIGTVGGEVGLYHRKKGAVSVIDHYNCAAKDEWLNMELTVLWDEFNDGVYRPQLTRNYSLHWWQTGYVDGQLINRNDSSPLRLLSRITFKTEEQAAAFEQALINKGFTPVSTFKPDVKDTCKRYKNDVIFLWQDVR